MKPWMTLTLKIIGGILALILLCWIGMAIYISNNKETIKDKLLSQVNSKINGSLSIASIEPSLLRGFPGVSLGLNDVRLKDSLFASHKKELINAKKIYVSLNIFSLLAGKTNIQRIRIHDANILLLTDSNGYSNANIFKKKQENSNASDQSPGALEVRNIDFKNVHLTIENLQKNKKFDFQIEKFFGKVRYPIGGFKGNLDLKTQVNSLSFNTQRGSFLKDKLVKGTLKFEYIASKNSLTIEPNRLDIGKDQFVIGAILNPKEGSFNISVKADNIQYASIAHLLAPNISEKLLKFNIDKNIQVEGTISDDGSGKSSDPLIKASLQAKNAKVDIPSGFLEKANFTGKFTNQQASNLPIGDENSVIEFTKLSANYYNIPITIDTFFIKDLSNPLAIGRVKSSFPIKNLNKTIGSDLLEFNSGTVDVNLYCRADIDNFQFTKPFINGKVEIKGADILHKATKSRLTNNLLTLSFTDKDLKLNNSKLQMGKSSLNMDLEIRNFLNLYYTDPELITVNIKMASSQLNLGELIPILSPRTQKKKKKASGNQISAFVNQFENIFDQSKMNIQLNVDRAIYKRFVATKLNANVSLIGTTVLINNVGLNHAGGSIALKGDIRHNGSRNVFALQSSINRVNVRDFFYAFENFGQTSITDKNIRGVLSAQSRIGGFLTNTGTLAPKSINGNLSFSINNAALVNFEPLIKAGKFAFANRNFSNITMNSLNGKLTINGEKVNIAPMEISSNVINMNVEGVYSMGKGTNIFVDIPLRNPERDANLSAAAKRENRMKGVVLRLKAIDGEDGTVKIRWNGNRNKAEK